MTDEEANDVIREMDMDDLLDAMWEADDKAFHTMWESIWRDAHKEDFQVVYSHLKEPMRRRFSKAVIDFIDKRVEYLVGIDIKADVEWVRRLRTKLQTGE